MKFIVTETNNETNETHMWEYDTEDAAVENVKHMLIPELQGHLPSRTIRMFKAEEIDISNINGYSLDELSKRNTIIS